MPKAIRIFDNTVVAVDSGIRVVNPASGFPLRVVGNAVFAATPIQSPTASDNVTDAFSKASAYLVAPTAPLGKLDLFPQVGKLSGSTTNLVEFSDFPDYNIDFNGVQRTTALHGAYAEEGSNPGWQPALEIKP